MKRLGGLWPAITAWDNLYRAWRQARAGKRDRPAVVRFGQNLEAELYDLQTELRQGSYRPGRYRLFTLYERKPRQIAAAPFRDRVVHHALMNLVEPPIDSRFIHDSYACRRNKGVHKAVDRYQRWSRNYRYALKIDIASYFASIDHALLKAQLRRVLKDRQTLNLLDAIIDGSPPPAQPPTYFPGDDLLTPLARRRGIPIGNLTSQFFANFYLNGLDHFIKQELKCRAYLRYVDDLVLLANDKPSLWAWRAAIDEYLSGLRLCLHLRKCYLIPVSCGLDVLGYRVWPHRRQLRNDNGHRFARKLSRMAAAWRRGKHDFDDLRASIASWVGHARHGDSKALREQIFAQVAFQRRARDNASVDRA